jgi:hypothetical protein
MGLARFISTAIGANALVIMLLWRHQSDVARPILAEHRGSGEHAPPRGRALAAFLEMSLQNLDLGPPLQQFDAVPALSGLDFFLWETDPRPIYMVNNSHMRWYSANANEGRLVGIMRHVLTVRETPSRGIVVDMGINDGAFPSNRTITDVNIKYDNQ